MARIGISDPSPENPLVFPSGRLPACPSCACKLESIVSVAKWVAPIPARPIDIDEEVPVLVTFLEPHRVDLRAHGIDEAHAAELRARLSTFAADWDGAEMDVYDDYDTARARLQAG